MDCRRLIWKGFAAMSDYRRWTSEEEQYIRDHWKTQSDAEMATALKRMEGAVRAKRRELRCSPQKTWTPEEERYLEDHWGTVSIPGIAKKLERTVSAIKVRAERLGLGGVLDSGRLCDLQPADDCAYG